MAKGDFKVEEPDYYVNDDNEKDSSVKQEQTEIKQEQPVDIYHQDYSENSDFSHIGVNKDMDYIDSSNIVFEDKQRSNTRRKSKILPKYHQQKNGNSYCRNTFPNPSNTTTNYSIHFQKQSFILLRNNSTRSSLHGRNRKHISNGKR